MSQSQNTLAPAVLRQIGVLGAEEPEDASDVALIKVVYVGKHAEWTERGYVDWPLTTDSALEIPDNVFQIVVNLIANEVLPAFGTPNPEENRAQREQILLVALRRLVAGTELDACFFTKKRLGTYVLRRLGIFDPLANSESQDAADVWAAYDAVFTRLSARDLTYWENGDKDAEVIPKEVFFDLVRIVSDDVAPILNAQIKPEPDESGNMLAPSVIGMRNLRRLIGRSPTGLPTRAEYF
jgi:hypothetical protein